MQTHTISQAKPSQLTKPRSFPAWYGVPMVRSVCVVIFYRMLITTLWNFVCLAPAAAVAVAPAAVAAAAAA